MRGYEMHQPSPEAIARFEEKWIGEPNTGCWLWLGTDADKRGYGRFQDRANGGGVLAHRFAYAAYRGDIPAGLDIDHLCRQPCCVNPDHLELVTRKENVLRGYGFTAENARKTHCKRGHSLSGENLMLIDPKRRHRACRECHREASRRWKKANPGYWAKGKSGGCK